MVANLLCQGLQASQADSTVNSEIIVSHGNGPVFKEFVPETDVFYHIHSTKDWSGTLKSLDIAGVAPVITMHDASILTGGCVYPLECQEWMKGCCNCLRGYTDSESVLKQKKKNLLSINPILVSPSRWLADMAEKAFSGLRIRVVPNGIRVKVDVDVNVRHLSDFKGKLVLFVAHGGTKAGYKSGSRWIEIWNKIKQREPQCRALFIGSEKSEQLKDVFQLPYLPNSTLRTVMQYADVLVYPSLADNHPLVVLEAMMSRLPVVAFAVGGIPEQVHSGKTGMLVRPGDLQTLSRGVVSLLRDRMQAQELADNAFKLARQRFSCEKMLEGYLKVYDEL